MSEQTVLADKQFLALLTPFLQKDFIRYCVWSVSRINGKKSVRKLYQQCQLASELINHYQPVYHLTHKDKRIIFAGCLLADTGKQFSETRYARIGYGLAYEYIARSAPDEFDSDTIDCIAQCVYDTRPERRQPPMNVNSQLVLLANQGKPSANVLASRIIRSLLGNGVTDERAIINHTHNELTYQFGENGVYWRNYPEIGKHYFFDEWQNVLVQFEDNTFLSDKVSILKRKHNEQRHHPEPDLPL